MSIALHCILVMCVSVFKLSAFVHCFLRTVFIVFVFFSAAFCVSINEWMDGGGNEND